LVSGAETASAGDQRGLLGLVDVLRGPFKTIGLRNI